MSHYPSGHVVKGRYMLAGILGEGGHGVVYRAVDLLAGAAVAIKFLRMNVAFDREFRVRMLREAQAMTALAGTSAVQIWDMDTDVNGVKFLVMELLSGQDLEDYLRMIEAQGQRLSVAHLFELLKPIIDTLEAAHNLGIIHRDLKPSNIFVTDNPIDTPVRLLDFGLVKLMAANPLTANGMVAGSPSYIAPETWQGKPQELDQRIDVYSMGVIVFRALAGRPPFQAKGIVQTLHMARDAPRPSLYALRSDLPRSIDRWVKRALAVKPEDRFSTVRELWQELQRESIKLTMNCQHLTVW